MSPPGPPVEPDELLPQDGVHGLLIDHRVQLHDDFQVKVLGEFVEYVLGQLLNHFLKGQRRGNKKQACGWDLSGKPEASTLVFVNTSVGPPGMFLQAEGVGVVGGGPHTNSGEDITLGPESKERSKVRPSLVPGGIESRKPGAALALRTPLRALGAAPTALPGASRTRS